MTPAWSSLPGQTRICPHCEAKILKTATVCPGCHRHLHFDAVRTHRPAEPTFCPLNVEGTIHHPGTGEPWEYSVILEIHDDDGEVISRQVMGVGALRPTEIRTFTVRVEVFAPQKSGV